MGSAGGPTRLARVTPSVTWKALDDFNDVSEAGRRPGGPAEPAPHIESRFLSSMSRSFAGQALAPGGAAAHRGDEGPLPQRPNGSRWKSPRGLCTTTGPTRRWRGKKASIAPTCGRRSRRAFGVGQHGLRARDVIGFCVVSDSRSEKRPAGERGSSEPGRRISHRTWLYS